MHCDGFSDLLSGAHENPRISGLEGILALTTHAGIPLISSLTEVLVLPLLGYLQWQRVHDCTTSQVALTA